VPLLDTNRRERRWLRRHEVACWRWLLKAAHEPNPVVAKLDRLSQSMIDFTALMGTA
jgi:hypothetical protein